MRDTKPIHYQITDILRQRIGAGQYAETGLPPELLLVEEFGVSRHTIRSALQRLVSDGIIERRAGRGTTVVQRNSGGSWIIGSLADLLEYSMERVHQVSGKLVPAREFPHVAAVFGTPLSGKVFQLVRLLMTEGGQISSIARIYTSAALAARLPKKLIEKELFIDLIEQNCGVRTERVRQVSSAALADEENAAKLETRVGEALLLLFRTYTSTDGEPIMYMELTCRPDRYQHTINFMHERRGNGAEAPAEQAAAQ